MPDHSMLLIVGLGNIHRADDGLGVHAVARLVREYELPATVGVIDALQGLEWVLAQIVRTGNVIVVDAVPLDEPAGSLVRLPGPLAVPLLLKRLAPSPIGMNETLLAAQLLSRIPEHLVLAGMVPATTALGLERSTIVEERLPALLELIAAEASALGQPLRPRLANESIANTRHAAGALP